MGGAAVLESSHGRALPLGPSPPQVDASRWAFEITLD